MAVHCGTADLAWDRWLCQYISACSAGASGATVLDLGQKLWICLAIDLVETSGYEERCRMEAR